MNRSLAAVAAVLLAVALTAAPNLGLAQSGSSWPTYRGSAQRSGSTSANGPTTSSVLNQWKLPKAPGGSLAIDAAGVAYVGDADGNVYALDPATPAKPKWTFAAKGPVFSTPTLSSDGKTLYVGSIDNNVYAINTATGKQVWVTPVRGQVTSSPLLSADGSTLYVNDQNGNVEALKTADGSVAWGPVTFSPGGSIPGSLALSTDGSTLYAATYAQILYGIPAAGVQGNSGSTPFYMDGNATSTPAVDTNGNVYVTTDRGSLMAFTPGSNGPQWTFKVPFQAPADSSPAVGGGLVIFGDRNQTLYAVNSSNGNAAWSAQTGGAISSSPVIAGNGMVYVGSGDGLVYAFDTHGKQVWTYSTGAPVTSSPAIGPDGSLWIGSQSGIVYRFKPFTEQPPSPPASNATPTPTVGPGPGATPTSPTSNLFLIKVKGSVKVGTRQSVTVTTAPNTLVRFRVEYPNGDHQSHRATTNAAGKVTYSYKQAASKIMHNRFYASVLAWKGPGSVTIPPQGKAQYKILFGSIDVTAEPRTQRVGGVVNIYIHSRGRTGVTATLTFPNRRVATLRGRTGPKGWAHLRYKVARGMTSGKKRKVAIVARLQSRRPNISTKTSFTIR